MRSKSSSTGSRRGQRGSVLIIAMVALVALAGLGGFTALSVQGGVAAQSASRFQGAALYAAEAGVAAGMEFLRANIDPIRNWTAFVDKDNVNPPMPIETATEPGVYGNNAMPGDTDNPFEAYDAWYQVRVLNNHADPGFSLDPPTIVPANILDQDGRVTLHVTGYGPNGARVVLEVDVVANNADRIAGRPCPAYSQKGLSEDGAGRNDCLGSFSGAPPEVVVAPGGP
jgi:hypothetical protein